MKLSVCITAFNEEKKIEECLKSVQGLADEVIVVDNNSEDKTFQIAKKYTDKVFKQENDQNNIDLQKNFSISKAKGDWILILDADERVTLELAEEIRQILDIGYSIKDKKEDRNAISNIHHPPSNINGYWIQRKNIIFGKWIENTGWYPDYQLRLFRRGKGKFIQKKVHGILDIEGETFKLNSPLLHENYDNVSSFLERLNVYTISEADSILGKEYKYDSFDIVKMPLAEFVKRYFAQKGYKDGMHGLVLSILMAFYHFVVFLRLWEKKGYPEEQNNEKLIAGGSQMIKKEFKYWVIQSKISDSKNVLNKQILKIKRKILM